MRAPVGAWASGDTSWSAGCRSLSGRGECWLCIWLTPVGAHQVNPWGAMAAPAELAAYRERLWAALSTDNAGGLESGLLEVVVAEAHANRATGFRRVLLQALDVSSVAQSARIGDLVQRYAEFAKLGSADAAVLLGAMLCFHATGNSQARTICQQRSQPRLRFLAATTSYRQLAPDTLIVPYQKKLTATSSSKQFAPVLSFRLPPPPSPQKIDCAAREQLRGACRTWCARVSATWRASRAAGRCWACCCTGWRPRPGAARRRTCGSHTRWAAPALVARWHGRLLRQGRVHTRACCASSSSHVEKSYCVWAAAKAGCGKDGCLARGTLPVAAMYQRGSPHTSACPDGACVKLVLSRSARPQHASASRGLTNIICW